MNFVVELCCKLVFIKLTGFELEQSCKIDG